MVQNLNFKIQLKDYIITDLNYKFDENIFPLLASEFSKINKESTEFDLLTKVTDQNTMQVAIHTGLKEVVIKIDTRVKEHVDLTELSHHEYFDDKEFILKSLDISMKFNFVLEYENDLPPNLSENEEFINELGVRLENSIIDICRHHMIITIRNLTSLDNNPPFTLEFPEFKLDDIEIR